MPISKPHSTLGAQNTGSCSLLANYLDKENQELEIIINTKNSLKEIILLQNRKQEFFNHAQDKISPIEVINSIDNNIKKLGKNDAKYFAPTISFSQSELKHIISLATNKKGIDDVWQLNNDEYIKYNRLLKDYITEVINNYAENFNRQNKGLKSGRDLVYFAKIEHFRKFKGTDEEVKQGLYKTGDFKSGLNTHAHIIVSRKDKTQRLKLTPTTKERSTQRIIGGNSYQIGFDRMKWINMNESSFDNLFEYKRSLTEKFNNQYILKKGSPKEKSELIQKIEKTNRILEPKKGIKTNRRSR